MKGCFKKVTDHNLSEDASRNPDEELPLADEGIVGSGESAKDKPSGL